MKGIRVILTGLMLLATAGASATDNFRVRSMTTVTLDSSKPEAQNVELGYNDAIGILFPENTRFLRGLEIEIKIPQDIIEYRNSMAYGIYRQVKPNPDAKTIDYQGEQITMQALPSRLTYVIQIPLQKGHNLRTGPYSTVIPYTHDPASGVILFRLLPVMKGLPENIESLIFQVKIRPILTEEGGFRLKLAYPAEPAKPVSVRVDEILAENPEALQILAPGSHHLSVVSDDYRNEVRVFTVESARVTDLTVLMQDTTPRLVLVAPENARIFLDSLPVENPRAAQTVTPGDHTILFRIGDYEVTKLVTVEKGRDYTVSMIIDISVTETP
jgi:hypothetical protein